MTTAEGFAPAKINLTLHVTGQRADGYHLLDSLVAFADIGDRLWYEPGDTLSLEVTGPFSGGVPTGPSNLVWRAAELCGWTGLIRLEKNLPHGAGIGGGSSDAAAVLRDLGGPFDRAAELGADVPVCLSPVAQRMRGIGEDLEPMPLFPTWNAVLVNPAIAVPTPQVFAALARTDNAPMARKMPAFAEVADAIAWLSAQRNDLQEPAVTLAPVIAEALQLVSETEGCGLARMSGSGATCFGVYAERDQGVAAAERIAAARPGWWVQAVRLG